MKMRLLAAASAAALSLLAAGCTSSSSSSAPKATLTATPTATSMTGTETLTAVDEGKTAAANLNSNDTPLTFPAAYWSGPVSTVVRPFTLPGGNSNGAAVVTLVTPAGNVRVHHSANQVPGSGTQPPPATWTKTGSLCHFDSTFSRGTGTWLSGTGKFTGARGSFTYLVTAQGYVPLLAGKTSCSFTTTGKVQSGGAQIRFFVTGPLTVRA